MTTQGCEHDHDAAGPGPDEVAEPGAEVLSLRLALRVAIGKGGERMFAAVMESFTSEGIAGEVSLRDIAARHGVSRSSLARRLVRVRAAIVEACRDEGLDTAQLLALMTRRTPITGKAHAPS